MLFATEAKIIQEMRNKPAPGQLSTVNTSDGTDYDLSTVSTLDGIDVTAIAWRVELLAEELDLVCVKSVVLWKATEGICHWIGTSSSLKQPSTAMWSPPSCTREGAKPYNIPVLTMLNDMMKSATHPEVFEWSMFTETNGLKKGVGAYLSAYGNRFCNPEFGDSDGTICKNHICRDITRFGRECLLPLWSAIIDKAQRHHRPSMLVELTLPLQQSPVFDLEIPEFTEPIAVQLPITMDKPGDKSLVSIPIQWHKLKHENPPTPVKSTSEM